MGAWARGRARLGTRGGARAWAEWTMKKKK